MEAVKETSQRHRPEQLIHGVVRKLTQHALLDALLVFVPPLAAVLYCLFYLYSNLWISPVVTVVLGVAALAADAVAITIRYRPKIPSAPIAARLIDDRAGAEDRFLTLATLPPSPAAASLMSRLRAEAAGLQARVAIRHEFPYRIKRHIYASWLISLAAALLFQLLLPLAHSTLYPQPAHERLRDLAQRMTQRPNLRETALSLHNLAAKLEDPKLPSDEKQRMVEEERKNIGEQQKKQTQEQDRDLLNQAAGTLEGIEQQSGGAQRKKDQAGGAGGIQSNLPQQGQGEGKQSDGSGGDNKGALNAQLNNEMQQGKMTRGNPNEQGKEKNPGEKNSAVGNQLNPNNAGKDESKERSDKTEGGKDERTGRSKASEEVPHGAPPAERFHKPGEGDQGIKGMGYVTVQLPEELAAEGKGGGQKKLSKGGKSASSQVPVSNVPLPRHMPDAPAERQQMPLEYRGIIR
jgi:hypothetical protein